MFNTQYREHVRFFSDCGDPIKVIYKPKFDDRGVWHLEKAGTENLYDYIQSFAASCDINTLMKRYENGEVDVLARVQGLYGDFSGMPESYIDMFNLIESGRINFLQLPVEIREKFNNSFEEFVAAMDSPDFFKKFEDDKVVDSKEDDVSES